MERKAVGEVWEPVKPEKLRYLGGGLVTGWERDKQEVPLTA